MTRKLKQNSAVVAYKERLERIGRPTRDAVASAVLAMLLRKMAVRRIDERVVDEIVDSLVERGYDPVQSRVAISEMVERVRDEANANVDNFHQNVGR
jgi:mannose/fructose-specific phosphotransferase system component IIA